MKSTLFALCILFFCAIIAISGALAGWAIAVLVSDDIDDQDFTSPDSVNAEEL